MALTAARFAERPLAAYNAVVAALWLTTAHGPLAALLGAAHLAAATLPWLFRAAPPRRATNLLRDLYPLLLVPALWIEMDLLHRAQAAPCQARHHGAPGHEGEQHRQVDEKQPLGGCARRPDRGGVSFFQPAGPE